MKKNPKVGIIVLSYNSERYIERCLESVVSQNYSNVIVYVIDNASDDATLKKVSRFQNIKVIKNEENLGFAGGNNVGIRKALEDCCDVVFLLNDDAYIEKQTIEILVLSIEGSKRVGAIQTLILLHQDKEIINSFGNSLHYLGFGYAGGYKKRRCDIKKYTTDITYASGAAVLYTKEALLDVGLFDETFFLYHEDLDLSWRMRLKGWSIILEPKALAYHEYNFSKGVKKYYYMERNRILFLLKNFSVHYLLLISPLLLVTEIGLDIFSVKNGFANERLRAWLFLANKDNRKKLWKARKLIQKTRTVSDRKLVSYLSDEIHSQELESALTRTGNRVFRAYFMLIRRFI